MKVVMWDMVRADDFATVYLIKDSSKTLKQHIDSLYGLVFAIHHTNRKTFYHSLDYYYAHPDLNKILMDSVYNFGTRQRGNSTTKNNDSLIKPTTRFNKKVDRYE